MSHYEIVCQKCFTVLFHPSDMGSSVIDERIAECTDPECPRKERLSEVYIKDLTVIYEKLHQLLYDEKYTEIDNILDHLEWNKMNTTTMFGVLRYTFASRKHLNNWENALSRVIHECNKRDININKALRGLI